VKRTGPRAEELVDRDQSTFHVQEAGWTLGAIDSYEYCSVRGGSGHSIVTLLFGFAGPIGFAGYDGSAVYSVVAAVGS
jgi:hypothetical protein